MTCQQPGPVLAADLPEYLMTHTATPQMRMVRFNLRERLVLIPVELIKVLALAAVIVAVRLIFRESLKLLPFEAFTAIMAAVVLFPILLPCIPTVDFATNRLARPEACMECGACQLNCPEGAINVESGVGCAYAMFLSALTGRKEITCGGCCK